MQPSSSNLVDLCLADVLQDVTGDNLSAQEVRHICCKHGCLSQFQAMYQSFALQASDAWRQADKDASFSRQQATLATAAGTAYEQLKWDANSEHTPEAGQDLTEELDAQQEGPGNDDSMQDVSDSPAEPEETAQEWTEQEPSGHEESPALQQQQSATQEEIAEQLPGPPAVKQTSRQEQQDRSAATLSKELRKLQAETTVLQAHSKRLQEKAATIQQQRAADQASVS